MTVSPIVWPRDLLRPRSVAVDSAPRTTGGAASLSGITQAVAVPAGVWTIRYDKFPVLTPDRVLAWRALAAQIEGRANRVVVPVWASVLMRDPPADPDPVAHDDGAFFSDGSGYLGSPFDITVAAAALGATAVTLAVARAPVEIAAGQDFSIGLRLYRIAALEDAGDGVHFAATVWPPLRDDVPAGSVAEFWRPVCQCRLASDKEMALPLDLGRFGTPSVSFIEDPS